jgi:succinate dehydrogenase/fumarate reductase-like Fe-S protein
VLDAGNAIGAELPYSCKAGVCSTCKCKVIEGEVEMDSNHALEDYEVAAGYVLSCQTYPVSDKVVLDFDQLDTESPAWAACSRRTAAPIQPLGAASLPREEAAPQQQPATPRDLKKQLQHQEIACHDTRTHRKHRQPPRLPAPGRRKRRLNGS